MIEKIVNSKEGVNYISYDLTKLTQEELDFAKAMWGKGWNSFMEILPNITSDEAMLEDGTFPYNRKYDMEKQPLVTYFSNGLRSFDKK
jgi:hypothetical protein